MWPSTNDDDDVGNRLSVSSTIDVASIADSATPTECKDAIIQSLQNQLLESESKYAALQRSIPRLAKLTDLSGKDVTEQMTELTRLLTDRDYQLENTNALCARKHEEFELVRTELFRRLRVAEQQMAEAMRRAKTCEAENCALREQLDHEQPRLFRVMGPHRDAPFYGNNNNVGSHADDVNSSTGGSSRNASSVTTISHYEEYDEEKEEEEEEMNEEVETKSRVFGASFAPLHTRSMLAGGTAAAAEPRYRPTRGRPSKTVTEKFLSLCFQGIKGVEREHWEVIMEKDTLSFMCKLCCRLFNNCYALKQHIRFVHMKIRPFPCGMCAKKFRSMYDLRRHGSTHTQERYACLHCGSEFGSRQRAYAHARETCVGADLASTLSPAYAAAKRRLASQWERIQLDNSLGAYANDNGLEVGEEPRVGPWRDDATPKNGGGRRRVAANEPSMPATLYNVIFPIEPIPVDIPDLW